MPDDSHYTYPESGASHASFSPKEWARAKKALEKLKERLAAKVTHLIKSGEPVKRPNVSRKKIQRDLGEVDDKLRAAEQEARGYEDEE